MHSFKMGKSSTVIIERVLAVLIYNISSLNWAQRVEIVHGIAIGVAYLQRGQVIHTDLCLSSAKRVVFC